MEKVYNGLGKTWIFFFLGNSRFFGWGSSGLKFLGSDLFAWNGKIKIFRG